MREDLAGPGHHHGGQARQARHLNTKALARGPIFQRAHKDNAVAAFDNGDVDIVELVEVPAHGARDQPASVDPPRNQLVVEKESLVRRRGCTPPSATGTVVFGGDDMLRGVLRWRRLGSLRAGMIWMIQMWLLLAGCSEPTPEAATEPLVPCTNAQFCSFFQADIGERLCRGVPDLACCLDEDCGSDARDCRDYQCVAHPCSDNRDCGADGRGVSCQTSDDCPTGAVCASASSERSCFAPADYDACFEGSGIPVVTRTVEGELIGVCFSTRCVEGLCE